LSREKGKHKIMAKKEGFLLYYKALENLRTLGNDIAIEVIYAMSKYDQGEDIGELSPIAQFALNTYIPYLDKSKKRWEAKVNNGSNGGRPPAAAGKAPQPQDEGPFADDGEPNDNLEEPNDNLEEPNLTEGEPNVTVTVTETVTETENVNVNDNEFNGGKISALPGEPPEDRDSSTAEAVALEPPDILPPENPENLPALQNGPSAFSPVDSPPKRRKKLELTPEQNELYHAAKACFELSDKAKAIIYQDHPSAEMQMKKLKDIIIRCSNIAPGMTVDFLKSVLEHFRVMTNGAKYKGSWVFTPRCLSTYWIWEIVISSLPERETELDRNIQESIKTIFKRGGG
jgi:hypothetical protein